MALYHLTSQAQLNPSMTLEFKFQLLPRMEKI